jgi:hypothetical protein
VVARHEQEHSLENPHDSRGAGHLLGVGVYPIVASSFGINSPSALMQKQLKLGLDLKGGVHLVLRVQTDDAIRPGDGSGGGTGS